MNSETHNKKRLTFNGEPFLRSIRGTAAFHAEGISFLNPFMFISFEVVRRAGVYLPPDETHLIAFYAGDS